MGHWARRTMGTGTMGDLEAAIAQLGESQTEDLKVPGSIPGIGIYLLSACAVRRERRLQSLSHAIGGQQRLPAQDSNLESPAPEADALSLRPAGSL